MRAKSYGLKMCEACPEYIIVFFDLCLIMVAFIRSARRVRLSNKDDPRTYMFRVG